MRFVLSHHNILEYLKNQNLCNPAEADLKNIKPIDAKNFNLLVTLSDGKQLLVKQERHNQQGNTYGEFVREWRFQEFLQTFPELNHLNSFLPEVLHFDKENSLIVCRYLEDYQDLMSFYSNEKIFDNNISEALGELIGTIHSQTFNRLNYLDFFLKSSDNLAVFQVKNLILSLERIEPEIFSLVPADGLKFFALYQKFDSLGQAMSNLGNNLIPACLTHNDLKLNNILLHANGHNKNNKKILRLIDWERSAWGDPAFDLGTLISSYLQIWLTSLVISKSLSLDESLRLAVTPLETLQPTIKALAQGYFQTFPEILEHRPDFVPRVVQFAGFGLIQQILAMVQYQKTFGNTGVAMLQVAKSLLCRPEQSIPTIFGVAELTPKNAVVV